MNFEDKLGMFVAGNCGNFEDVFSPLQSEAMAFREGLAWTVDRGFQDLF